MFIKAAGGRSSAAKAVLRELVKNAEVWKLIDRVDELRKEREDVIDKVNALVRKIGRAALKATS